jgi:DnaJ-domain-containing protein 1
LSRAKAAAEFATALSTALNSQQRDAQQGLSDAPPPRAATESDLSAAFVALGLQPGAFFDDVTAAYRKLAAQNHPDKVAHPEFRELAERKMRELNEAYDQIRAAYHQR